MVPNLDQGCRISSTPFAWTSICLAILWCTIKTVQMNEVLIHQLDHRHNSFILRFNNIVQERCKYCLQTRRWRRNNRQNEETKETSKDIEWRLNQVIVVLKRCLPPPPSWGLNLMPKGILGKWFVGFIKPWNEFTLKYLVKPSKTLEDKENWIW